MRGERVGVFVYGFMSVGVLLSALLVSAVVVDARTVFADPTRGGYESRLRDRGHR